MSLIEDRNRLKAGMGLEDRNRIRGLGTPTYTVPVKQAPIKPDILDQAESAWNNVSQPVRDLLLQPASDTAKEVGLNKVSKLIDWTSDVIMPESIVVDGKRQGTENKTFNNLSIPELKKEVDTYTTTPDKANGIIYQIRDVNTGDIKWGRSQSKDAFGRWGADKNFGENFEVLQEIPVTDMHYVERLIHGNKNMIKAQQYGYGNQTESPLTGGGTEIYRNDPLTKASMSKVQQLLNPDQIGLAEQVYEQVSTVGRKWGLAGNNIAKARLESMADQQLGAGIGINKAVGGVADLLGDSYGKQRAQQRATKLSKAMADKDSASATVGEILPELGLPAVGFISKTASLAKRVIQGAGSGAIITGGYEKLKEQSGIKEGLETNVAFSTGAGGVIGGIVGAITKNPALGKSIGEAFEQGDDKAKEAILEAYPQARGAVDEYFRANKPVPSQTQKPSVKNTVTQSDSVKPDYEAINPLTGELEKVKQQEPRTPERRREEVRAKREKTRTKAGEEITSKEVLTGKKSIEDIEYNVVEPKAEVGKELEGQTYIPKVSNPKKFTYGYDARGRIYTEESNLMSPQGGATQKASLEQRAKPEIESASEEVSRRMDFFDNDQALRSRYGQTQAGYKEEKEIPKSQEIANRLQFEKDQYKAILKDKTLVEEIKQEARTKLSELNKVKITDYVATQKELAQAEAKFQDQFKVESKTPDIREKEISKEYQSFKKSEEARTKEGYVKPTLKSESKIKRQIVQNATDLISTAKKAIAEVSKKERLNGKTFDVKKITPSQRKAYRDEIATIEDVQNARLDLQSYKDGKITLDELQYREKRRIDEQLSRTEQSRFKSKEELEEYKKQTIQRYESIGVHVKDSDIKMKESIERSGKKETPEKKVERETKEIKQSEAKHNQLVRAIDNFRKTGKIPRVKSGERAGQKILSDSQIEDIRKGILSSKEIADKTSPIGKLEDINDLKVSAKEQANLKTTKAEQEKLGIKWTVNPKDIQFKETLQDASNSVAQVTAVLLGSKNLGKLAKSAGSESVGDIRVIIADEMGKTLPKDFPIVPSKDSVKPTFMTENYGQGQKGLVRNIMKANNVSREVAQQFLDAYNKAFDNIAPEMVALRNRIMETFKAGNGKVEYTMPDGFVVKFELKKELDGTYSIKGRESTIKVKTDNVDDMSSAILPNIIHSVDAYVAREMNKHGIATVHDAFQTPKGMTDEFVQKKYGEIMSKINDSNLLDHILKSIGDTKPSMKKGDLSSEAIKESAKSKQSLAPEEVKGEVTKAKPRQIDVSTSKTTDEVMKEFMAKDNVREENANQLVKAMTNEAGYRTMSVARDSDDVFERQIALAHQSPNYNQKMAIEAPEGVNKAIWNRVQREIFSEARAKLEYNPLLNGIIKGERKYFTESGKLIGAETKTFQEILTQEKRIGRKLWKKLKQEDRSAVRQIAPNYEKLQIKVKSWETGKQLNNAESVAKNLVEKARQPEISRSVFRKNIDKVKAYFKDQISNAKETVDFYKLHSYKNFVEEEVGKRGENLRKQVDGFFKDHKPEDITNAIFRTDYNAIQDIKSAKEANEFMQLHDNLYQIAKPYVDQGAKAIGDSSEQVGFFRNNSRAIAEELNLPKEVIPILDRMISVKAMNDNAWKTIDAIRDTKDYKTMMEIISSNKIRSAREFHTNQNQQVKGYVKEYYTRTDAETGFEGGAIPSTLERQKVGTYEEYLPEGDFKNLKEKSEYAEKHRLKINENGNFRKVATAEEKAKLGRGNDFRDILAKTTQSIDAKETQKLISKNIIDEIVAENSMFSQKPKEGYRQITEREASSMPKVVGDTLAGRYINEAYEKRILGRDEVRLYNGTNHVGKVADRLLKNAVTLFKHNVILKNPKSYANATLFNQLIASTAGVNPQKLIKYQMEAQREINYLDKIRERISLLEARGKNTNRLKKLLEKSDLYQMEKHGLAINKLEVSGDDTTLLGQIMSDMTKGKLDRATHELYLSQKGKVGKEAFKVFGNIDTHGRYTLAKHFMDNGMKIEEAVRKANGLFGDMNQMAPAIIEVADKYGLMPFLKWGTLVTPQIMKVAGENPTKALMIAMSMYGLQMESNADFNSANPLESVVNFWDDTTSLDYMNNIAEDGIGSATYDKAYTYFVPKAYEEVRKELFEDGEHNFIFKDQQESDKYKPLTQRIVDE